MAKRQYDWENGAELKEHSKAKLNILGDYLNDYIQVRCKLPQQERFRITIVDGFCGAGRYKCGTPGSPLVILQTLIKNEETLRIARAVEGFRPITIEAFLIFNDTDPGAIRMLRENLAPMLAEAEDNNINLKVEVAFMVGDFKSNSDEIIALILHKKCKNILINLDQYGYQDVPEETLQALLNLSDKTEMFLTFNIGSFLAFLNPEKANDVATKRQVPFTDDILNVDVNCTKREWLGEIEHAVYQRLSGFAPFVSPFAIHNDEGWRYWLIHFANHYRARQVYNNVLHRNKTSQAHFGRLGLSMLEHRPKEQRALYLFEGESRDAVIEQLERDIPTLVSEQGRAIPISQFYELAYKQTAAHSDAIGEAIFANSDLSVVTKNGSARRVHRKIAESDMLILSPQKSFHFM